MQPVERVLANSTTSFKPRTKMRSIRAKDLREKNFKRSYEKT